MSSSILEDVKHAMGHTPEDTEFDGEIMMAINSTFSTLTQLGVGPVIGYQISSKDNVWEEFATDARLNTAKSYVVLCVKMLFNQDKDSGPVIQARERQKQEMEIRMNMVADYG